jgi:arginyl-tRNA synthetase
VLGACAAASDPYFLTVYLQELAESFHKFYDSHRVIGQEDGLTRARLVLIDAARIVLAKGLGLLGVSCPQRM